MKKIILCIGFLGLFSAAFAQTLPNLKIEPVINTGIKDLDENLNTINAIAIENPDKFNKEVESTFSVPSGSVQNFVNSGLQPAEVYLAYETADITKQPLNNVIDSYKKSKGKGWGNLAKQMGIKPGSKEFFALKDKVKSKKEKMNKERGESTQNGEKDKEKTNKGKGNSGSNGKGKKTK